MRVYLTGERHRAQPIHRLIVSPAAEIKNEEVPREWVSDQNEPVPITVEFAFGVAEVPTNMGKFLVSRGLAAKTQLILPRNAVLQGA